MTLTQRLGDAKTYQIPMLWEGRAFTPAGNYYLIWTLKADADADADPAAKIQKVLNAGITVSGSTASVSLVSVDTAGDADAVPVILALDPGEYDWDLQYQDQDNPDDVRTLRAGKMTLVRDVTRLPSASVPIYSDTPISLTSFVSWAAAQTLTVAQQEQFYANLNIAAYDNIVAADAALGSGNVYFDRTLGYLNQTSEDHYLSSTLQLYPTSTASDIGGYYSAVSSVSDADYDAVAVNIPTGAITGTNVLIASCASEAGLIVGNPGLINITVIGNIRKLTGATGCDATFHFELYQRNLAGAETLLGTSGSTHLVTDAAYEEYSANVVFNNGDWLSTDRLVVKFYGTKVGTGVDPTYEFEFGGSTPVRVVIPAPVDVLLDGYEPKTIKALAASPQVKTSDAAYADDAELTIAIPASGTYLIETSVMILADDTAGGAKLQVAYSGSRDAANSMLIAHTSASTFTTFGLIDAAASKPDGDTAGVSLPYEVANGAYRALQATLRHTLKATSAGTYSIQWAQSSSHASNVTRQSGSSIIARKLA